MADFTAYVDESGNLPNPDDRYVVLAALVVSNRRVLQRIVRKASRKLKKAHLKRRNGMEIKWTNAPTGTKRRVLEELARRDVQIFGLVVDKNHSGIADTPENYGLLVCELIRECLAYYPDIKLTVDVHFRVRRQRQAFDRYLLENTTLGKAPVHLDSQQDGIIQLADFVAGAIRDDTTGRGNLAAIIAGKIVVEKVVKWAQLAKKKRWKNRAVFT